MDKSPAEGPGQRTSLAEGLKQSSTDPPTDDATTSSVRVNTQGAGRPEDESEDSPEWVIDKILQEGVDRSARSAISRCGGTTSDPKRTHGNRKLIYPNRLSRVAAVA